MNFSQIVTNLANRANVEDAQRAIRVAHGTGASRWVAEEAGISPRTARRWLSSSPPAARLAVISALAARLIVAAQVMRRSTGTIEVGSVDVTYDGDSQGSRYVGEVDVDLEPIASALEEQDEDYAAQLFSNAIMDAYGPGLSDTLEIDAFHSDVRIN